jgi:hypothetical protein
MGCSISDSAKKTQYINSSKGSTPSIGGQSCQEPMIRSGELKKLKPKKYKGGLIRLKEIKDSSIMKRRSQINWYTILLNDILHSS